MKAIKLLVIVCLVLITAVSVHYLYNGRQAEQRQAALIKENEANKKRLGEASEKISRDTQELLNSQ